MHILVIFSQKVGNYVIIKIYYYWEYDDLFIFLWYVEWRINMNKKVKIVKKTFSLRNSKLFSNIISDEAIVSNKSESAVIEETVFNNYVGNNKELAFWVENILYEDEGVRRTLMSFCEHYSALPQDANDSALSLIMLMYDIEMKHRTIIKGDEKILHHFKEQLNSYIELVKKRSITNNNYFPVPIVTPEGKYIEVDSYTIILLEDIYKYIDTEPEMINGGCDIAMLIRNVYDYWNLGNTSITLKNWTRVWRMLADICNLANWPDLPEYRNRLLKIMKNVSFGNDSALTFDENEPILNNIIHIKNRSIRTTKDVIVIKTDDQLDDGSFKNAGRVIHGPSTSYKTKHPIIILYNDEKDDELIEIVRSKSPTNEFANTDDIFYVQILFDGKYFDNRIKWETI